MPPVFRQFNQKQLDAEYNNSGKVENAAEIIQWYSERSGRYTATATAELDMRYGPDTEESLDLYYANGHRKQQAGSRPLHVFFHGGYWQAMHKQDFSYVANAFSDTNTIVAIINYALIPAVSMSVLVQQCRHALLWLYHNVDQYGGDPQRISASGHSAGGHLIAMMMATDWPQLDSECPPDLLTKGVAISGLFDLEPIRLCYLNQVLGLSEDDAKAYSPVLLKKHNSGKLLCLYGEPEGEEYCRQSESLAAIWPDTSARAVSGHNHFSIAKELDIRNSPVSKLLTGFVLGNS